MVPNARGIARAPLPAQTSPELSWPQQSDYLIPADVANGLPLVEVPIPTAVHWHGLELDSCSTSARAPG